MCYIKSKAARERPRRFPKGDRKALWSRPQARNLCLCQSNRLKPAQYQSPFCKQKSREPIGSLRYGIRRRPMLPGRVQPSTFGTERLNFCVRDGNRWDPLVIATGNGELFSCGERDCFLFAWPSARLRVLLPCFPSLFCRTLTTAQQ